MSMEHEKSERSASTAVDVWGNCFSSIEWAWKEKNLVLLVEFMKLNNDLARILVRRQILVLDDLAQRQNAATRATHSWTDGAVLVGYESSSPLTYKALSRATTSRICICELM